jgi:hypothetical protein
MKQFTGILLVLMTACGSNTPASGDGDGMGGADAGAQEVDTTAPTIVAMQPENGAIGVRADVKVVIEFSEPMDQLSVQNSIDTSELGGVSFEWKDDSSTLVVLPDEPLEYAEGADPEETAALQYAVTIGVGARDEAGNAIEVGAQTIFKTLKSISNTLPRYNAFTGAGTPGGVITDADDFLYVGDDDAQAEASSYRGYMSIDFSGLPSTAVEIVSATLRGAQLAEFGAPYAALGNGSGLLLEHGVFTLGTQQQDSAAFNMTPLSLVGDFANTGDTALSIDVTAEAQDDLQNRASRGDLSQYRARFDTFTNLDDTADFVLLDRESLELDVVYLTP